MKIDHKPGIGDVCPVDNKLVYAEVCKTSNFQYVIRNRMECKNLQTV